LHISRLQNTNTNTNTHTHTPKRQAHTTLLYILSTHRVPLQTLHTWDSQHKKTNKSTIVHLSQVIHLINNQQHDEYNTHTHERERETVLLATEIPTMIDPSATINYPSVTGSIIVGIPVISTSIKTHIQKSSKLTILSLSLSCMGIIIIVILRSRLQHTHRHTHKLTTFSVCLSVLFYD